MELVQLRYFQMVARTGNMSKAAKALFITQPNLSKSIARLEAEIGVPLFDHRKGKIALNDYGRVFLSSVDLIFEELSSGTSTVQRLYENNQNILSLACPIDDFLPDVLRQFSLQHPEIGIRQFNYSQGDLLEHLLNRTLTLAITAQPLEHSRIFERRLGQKDYMVLMHKSHPLAAHQQVSLAQLAEERFICDASRLNLASLRRLCIQYGYEPKVLYEVESSELVYHLLEENAGVALMPLSQYAKIRKMRPGTDIRGVTIREAITPAYIGVAYHQDAEISPATRLFIDFIDAWLSQEEKHLSQLGFIV